MKKLALMAVAAVFMFAFATKAVMAQEKAKAEKAKPEKAMAEKAKKGEPTIKVLLENERVKVSEVTSRPGDKGKMAEKKPRVVYNFTDGHVRQHWADGTTKEVKIKTGEVRMGDLGTYAGENIGKNTRRFLVITPKEPEKKPEKK